MLGWFANLLGQSSTPCRPSPPFQATKTLDRFGSRTKRILLYMFSDLEVFWGASANTFAHNFTTEDVSDTFSLHLRPSDNLWPKTFFVYNLWPITTAAYTLVPRQVFVYTLWPITSLCPKTLPGKQISTIYDRTQVLCLQFMADNNVCLHFEAEERFCLQFMTDNKFVSLNCARKNNV